MVRPPLGYSRRSVFVLFNYLDVFINGDFTIKKERTDIIVYHPNIRSVQTRHRVEAKNVKLRERGTRGLSFDGDSLFEFFNDPNKFSRRNVKVIDKFCQHRNGYACIPPLN